jgi:hypothetical protein
MVSVRNAIRSIAISIALTFIAPFGRAWGLSNLSSADPYPMYKALDPQEFLFTREKFLIIGYPLELPYPQRWGVSLSPFGENACLAKNFCGDAIPLGDLGGRWNMVGLMFDPLPEGKVLPPQLQLARDEIFPDIPPGELTDERYVDPAQLFGFFSIPANYSRRGLRWEFSAMIWCNIGLEIQGGVADIVKKACGFDNLTCLPCSRFEQQVNPNLPPPCCARIIPEEGSEQHILCCGRDKLFPETADSDEAGSFNKDNINRYLMYELKTITEQIGLDICNFHETSLEDIRIQLFWRDAYYLNKGKIGWAEFLFMPYIEFGGQIATGKPKDPNIFFSVPFGNNGHNSIGALAGFNLDFIETIEIGADIGFTHFFPRDICNMRVPNGVPTRQCQLGIYPFTTDVHVQPGFNWEFRAKMLAYHFLERLSFYFQYLLVHHEKDRITLKKPDPAFRPEYLEESSYWAVQLANVGFYYDISPSFSLGFLWQAPLWQRNAYRTTTVLFSINATY